MNWKTTLILALLAALGGGWMYWDLRGDGDEGSGGVDALIRPLFPDAPYTEATRLELDRPAPAGLGDAPADPGAREHIVFERRGEAWFIAEPIQAPARREHLEAMIEDPCIRLPVDGLKPSAPLDEYGLGATALTVTLIHPAGRSVTRVGRRSGYQGQCYVMADGAEMVMLMDEDFDTVFRLPLAAYRADLKPPAPEKDLPTGNSPENP